MDYTKEYLKYKRNKKLKGIFIGIGILLVAIIGSTYAFFTYSKSLQAFTLTSSGITASFSSGTNQINITNGYPISDEFAIAHLNELDYIDFNISGNVEDESQGITYEIYLTEKDSNTLDPNYIKVYITDENGDQILNPKAYNPKIYNSLENTTYSKDATTGKVIYKLEGIPSNYSKSFRIYAWIDKDYEQNDVSQSFSFYVNLYAYNDENKLLLDAVMKNLTTTNDVPDNYVLEDGIYYISGCREDGDTSVCNEKNTIDFNYVWYSGKLWRITAIYPDGRMKMITEDPITAIYFGSNTTYEGSWMYQWLNEDFKDTLYNYQNIIDENATWNATMTTSTTKPSETTMVTAPIGSLNTYEYVRSYAKLGSYNTFSAYVNGYLEGSYWRLITPYSSSNVRLVSSIGELDYNSPSSSADDIRPSINLKSGIFLSSGDGSKSNPYKISGDKEEALVNTTLLNTRISGEYVTFKNELYRIVGIEDGATKIVKVDYIRDGSNAVVTKKFASSGTFGKSTNTKTDDYWDYYLNNTWLKNKFEIDLSDEHPEDTYETMLEMGAYYLGEYGVSVSYKNTICKTSNTTEKVLDCEKIDDTSKLYTGYVGLLRVGEMFSSQLGSGYNNSSTMWLITPFSSSVRIVNYGGSLGHSYNPSSDTYAVRPTINLKSTIVIKGGDGTLEHPFEIE